MVERGQDLNLAGEPFAQLIVVEVVRLQPLQSMFRLGAERRVGGHASVHHAEFPVPQFFALVPIHRRNFIQGGTQMRPQRDESGREPTPRDASRTVPGLYWAKVLTVR
jgi:hypothetical protein